MSQTHTILEIESSSIFAYTNAACNALIPTLCDGIRDIGARSTAFEFQVTGKVRDRKAIVWHIDGIRDEMDLRPSSSRPDAAIESFVVPMCLPLHCFDSHNAAPFSM